MKPALSFLIVCAIAIGPASNAENKHEHHSQYAGQEKRAIKSLSNSDIEQLRNGKGWGLAKAAELNGMPGPIHILEMKKEINLTTEQEAQVTALYNQMKSQAIPLGKRVIELERKLNDSFASQNINKQQLKEQLDELYRVYSELRYVHLVTHLQTPALLSKHQVTQYNQLRGYASGDHHQHHH